MTPEAQRYLKCMTEMKMRLFLAYDMADDCLSNDEFSVGNFEFGCLQLRKAIELIGFSGMVAEIDAYRSISTKFQKEWRLSDIIRALGRISSSSFPFKTRRESSTLPRIKWHIVPETEYAIEPDQLISWHGRLNEHLHASNPYGQNEDQRTACLRVKSNVADILALLAEHCFLRSDKSGGFLVTLGQREDNVLLSEFVVENNV